MNKTGDIEKPKSLDIKVDYMHLQDLGSGSYTEFDNDEDIIDLYTENEDLMNYRCGLIHSHHTMAAFFSGTDQEELHEKAENGLYLSLIVNNHMDPVCKLAWMGQIERKIETYNSWDLGHFIRKPKKVTKTELANVFYEIEMEINWDDSIAVVTDRYNELNEEEDIRAEAKRLNVGGKQISAFTDKESNGIGYFRGQQWEETKEDKKAVSERDPGKLTFTEKLAQKGILQTSYGAVLTQNPNTNLGFTGGLSVAMDDVRQEVQALNADGDLPKGSSFQEEYAEYAQEYANQLIIGGEDILTEKLDEFYLDDDEYYDFLQSMYDDLAKENGILVDALKQAIIAITVMDEEDEEDKAGKRDDERDIIVGV